MGVVGEHGGILGGDFLYSTSQAYKTAISKNARQSSLIGNITLSNGTSIALELFDIMSASLSSQCVNDEVFEIGAVYSSEFKIKIADWQLGMELLNNACLDVKYGLKLADGTIEYVPLGTFFVAEAVWEQGYVTLTCYDATIKFDTAFIRNEISFTGDSNIAKIYNVLTVICNQCGVTFGMTEAEVNNVASPAIIKTIRVPAVISTCREMLSYIAEWVGGFAYIDRLGKLRIKSFAVSSNPVSVIPRTDYFKNSVNDKKFLINNIAIYDSENKNYYFVDNENTTSGETLMSRWGYLSYTSFIVCYRNLLQAKLGRVEYTPSELEWLGDPAIDLGDTVAIETGRGATIKSLITHIDWTYKGSQRLKSVGNTATAETTKTATISTVQPTSDSEKQLINTVSQLISQIPSGGSSCGVISGYAEGLPVTLLNSLEVNIPFKNTQTNDNSYSFNGSLQIQAVTENTLTIKYFIDGVQVGNDCTETVPQSYSFKSLWTCLTDVSHGNHNFRVKITGTEQITIMALQFALNGQGISYEAGKEIKQMTGTGTNSDPFIVYTLEDFRWAIKQSCDYVKLGADLDCSELEYWTGLTANAGTIDLDGHTVKNINITPISADGNYFITADRNVTIKNGTIQSVYGTNVRWLLKVYNSSYNSPRTLNLTDLKLSGIFTLFNATDESFIKANYAYCQRVSLNFKFQNIIGNPLFYSGIYTYHRNCNYNVDFSTSVYSSSESWGIFNGRFYNSKITGKIHMTSTSTSSNNSLFYELNSSVIACQISSAGTKIELAYSGCNGATIVNKDLITATVVDTDSDIKLLTTVQMKDTEYLTNTAEFPVFEV